MSIIAIDSSVLINFLCIDRTDLLVSYSRDFVATDHVTAEITDHYSDQQQRLAKVLGSGGLSEISIVTRKELELFESLFAIGRLGAGECSTIALAISRAFTLTIDDRVAIKWAHIKDATLRIITTQDLIISFIQEGLLDIEAADRIRHRWATQHRFQLKLHSFRDLTR